VKYFLNSIIIIALLLTAKFSVAQYTHQDTLRGSINPERSWWDVLRYDITVKPDFSSKTIEGKVKIVYKVTEKINKNVLSKRFNDGYKMQIDLQEPMIIDKIIKKDSTIMGSHSKLRYGEPILYELKFERKKNMAIVTIMPLPVIYTQNKVDSITVFFHGKPREAIRPPWDGGWVWSKDAKGRPWMTVACQGLGASVWYPCKDHQSDEPDNGASLTITIPDSLVAVGNGKLVDKKNNNDGTASWKWEVSNPINNYNIIPYIGKYVNWKEDYGGEKGKLNCSYWVLDYNLQKSKEQFGRDVKPMLKCFEYWFGPYPFYEDGFKLVETSHLGMEHQSGIAYGNKFLNGYLGMDLSGTGWGNTWDYIIVHEAGHEWFANNITTNDIADMWVHEGFTTYSEVLFVECQSGKKAADEYCRGIKGNIQNDKPIIGDYGVNKEGSDDMYPKGATLIHTIRQVINDDGKFISILRGLNKTFYHKTIDSKDVEEYISRQSGKNLSKIFDQYLRTAQIPVLEYRIKGYSCSYRWTNCVTGFNMPVKVLSAGKEYWFFPTEKWQTQKMANVFNEKSFSIDTNFYIDTRKVQ
jgi:aminopeptidase N